jgi:hypothetical protein
MLYSKNVSKTTCVFTTSIPISPFKNRLKHTYYWGTKDEKLTNRLKTSHFLVTPRFLRIFEVHIKLWILNCQLFF